MTAPLVFLDTETTGLDLTDEIWEIGMIRRNPDGSESTMHLFVDHDPDKCAQLPERFLSDHRDRYPGKCGNETDPDSVSNLWRMATWVDFFTRRREGEPAPHIVVATAVRASLREVLDGAEQDDGEL